MNENLKRNALYLEYSGNAPTMSINYERNVFQKDLFKLFGRIGFGLDLVKFDAGNLFVPSVPLEISTSFGREKHFIEVGLGGTPFLSKTEMWSTSYNYDLDIDSIEYKLYFLFTPRLGYRFESKKHWLLRIAYTPILYNSSNTEDNYQTNFGISLGKIF